MITFFPFYEYQEASNIQSFSIVGTTLTLYRYTPVPLNGFAEEFIKPESHCSHHN
jgi:hypothetical protein